MTVNLLMAEVLKRPDAWTILDQIQTQLQAEFINGEIVIHSPVKKWHADSSQNIFELINLYCKLNQIKGFVGIEKIMIRLTRNDYEPDVCYFSPEKAQSLEPKQVLFPAPDLVVEVLSESTKANDRGVKFEDYQAHQITEYWLIDPENQLVEQYGLRDDKYELIFKASRGELVSEVIKGFEIPVRAIFDETENLKAIQKFL